MKKIMCCLMLLVMLVGCQRGPMYYEQGETYKINEQLEIEFFGTFSHYFLPPSLMVEAPVSTYKMIEIVTVLKNTSTETISNVVDMLNFSADVDGKVYTPLIYDESNQYGTEEEIKSLELPANSVKAVNITILIPTPINWEELVLSEKNSSKEWRLTSIDIHDGYLQQGQTDVTFFEKMTNIRSFQGHLNKFYGIKVKLRPEQKIYGITVDETLIELFNVKETEDEIMTENHLINQSSDCYGNVLYPIKGYIITDYQGSDIYINRIYDKKDEKLTYMHYFPNAEIGTQMIELDGENYQTGITFSAVVHYSNDGLIESVDSFGCFNTQSFISQTKQDYDYIDIGFEGQKGSYKISEDKKEAELTYKFKLFTETDESDWIELNAVVK